MTKIVRAIFSFLEKIKFHIVGVLIFVSCEIRITYLTGAPHNLLPFLIFYSVDIFFFYFNCYFIFPKAYQQRKSIYKPILLVLLSLSLQIGLKLIITPIRQPDPDKFLDSLFVFFLQIYSWRAITIAGIAALLWGWLTFVKLLKREKILENNSLYSRISPHLFFNGINFVHASVLETSEKGANMLTLLSEYCRYAMSELAEDGKVGLEVEIEQLRILIQIIELRYKDLQIVLDIVVDEPSIPLYRIPPQVIVSLAENIFKYGVLNEPDKAAMIAIQEKSGLLHVAMSNWKTVNDGSVSSKIGLDLIRKRLKNIYGDAFSLKIEETADYFKLKLTLQL